MLNLLLLVLKETTYPIKEILVNMIGIKKKYFKEITMLKKVTIIFNTKTLDDTFGDINFWNINKVIINNKIIIKGEEIGINSIKYIQNCIISIPIIGIITL